ncbi:uncharacterized protein LOC131234386 [Magnolia sinica]|uniref:uncharacterized protein LOC131234386 n=1 Tax=Magnolia sinica TaxID=86752 RepID=UPI00265ADE58|nr:uncharacterized protein LOC131234386 [Magnolia sinica]
MSTTPLPDQQQEQPEVYQEATSNGNYHGSGSVGPFFAVLSVIIVLAVLSCMVGRVCAARLEGLDSRYDCLEWVRRRCRRCIPNDVEVGAKAVDCADGNGKAIENEHPPAPPA